MVWGFFEERENRFRARIRVEGRLTTAYLPNPSHLREVLRRGARVGLLPRTSGNPYELVMVEADGRWVSVDARLPNALFARVWRDTPEWLPLSAEEMAGLPELETEQRVGGVRWDFRAGQWLIEVKSCTLVVDRRARFPDPATARGTRQMRVLREGWRGLLAVFVQREDADIWEPNEPVDPRFAEAFRKALREGLRVQVFRCAVHQEGVRVLEPIPWRERVE